MTTTNSQRITVEVQARGKGRAPSRARFIAAMQGENQGRRVVVERPASGDTAEERARRQLALNLLRDTLAQEGYKPTLESEAFVARFLSGELDRFVCEAVSYGESSGGPDMPQTDRTGDPSPG